MILVILGTQDKTFERLLTAVDREIQKGTIKDKVIVQAGSTKYESKDMEIFDYISIDKFDKLLKEADLIITHGGVGSIIGSLKQDKKVIAVPRLSKFKEHVNDHQVEIVEEFSKNGYILTCNDLDCLGTVLEKVKDFVPKQYQSNNNKMINIIENFIGE